MALSLPSGLRGSETLCMKKCKISITKKFGTGIRWNRTGMVTVEGGVIELVSVREHGGLLEGLLTTKMRSC